MSAPPFLERRGPRPHEFVGVCSIGHSGTKWLAETLDHPGQGVSFFHELKLRFIDIGWEESQQHEIDHGIDGLFQDYFDFICAQGERSRVVGDSMSWSFYSIPLVHRAFGFDKLVHLVRNGIQTVHSKHEHTRAVPRDHWLFRDYLRRYWEMAGRPFGHWDRFTAWEIWCFQWSLNLAMLPALEGLVGRERFFTLRFDDLISDVAALRRAVEAVAPGLEISDEALGAAQAADVNRKIAGERSPAAIWDGWSDEKRAAFERICGPAMAHFGYELPPVR